MAFFRTTVENSDKFDTRHFSYFKDGKVEYMINTTFPMGFYLNNRIINNVIIGKDIKCLYDTFKGMTIADSLHLNIPDTVESMFGAFYNTKVNNIMKLSRGCYNYVGCFRDTRAVAPILISPSYVTVNDIDMTNAFTITNSQFSSYPMTYINLSGYNRLVNVTMNNTFGNMFALPPRSYDVILEYDNNSILDTRRMFGKRNSRTPTNYVRLWVSNIADFYNRVSNNSDPNYIFDTSAYSWEQVTNGYFCSNTGFYLLNNIEQAKAEFYNLYNQYL